MSTLYQNTEKTFVEPGAAERLLAQIGLSREHFAALVPTQQTRLLRYLLPDPDTSVSGDEREALLELGQQLWQAQQEAEKPSKTLLLALLDLFLAINAAEQATRLFAAVYSEPMPQQVTYFQRSARLCLVQGDNLGAWEAAIDLRRAFPEAITTYSLLAELLLKMNDYAGAKRCYETALAINPESSLMLLGLAKVAFKQGTPEHTREIATRLEANPKNSWRTLRQLAGIWRELGDLVKAEELDRAAQLKREQGLSAALEGKSAASEGESESSGEIFEGIQVRTAENQATTLSLNGQTPQPPTTDLYPLLQEVFGHSQFRPGQAETITSVLAGRDTLAVLPTGSGKSLCYQLPALLLERPVLVISPLISLMKDQFDNLPPRLQEQSAIINSSVEPGEAARILRQVADGTRKLRLIYAAPERLRQYPFVAAMRQAGLGMVVVDEAHCVTMWGNDFRPDYLFIRRALDDLAATGHRPTLLAVTATATPAIATEIANQLGRTMVTVRGTMVRPNLYYRVIKAGGEERENQLVNLCRELQGSGIVYVRSRQNAERLAELLKMAGVSAEAYHAGLSNSARKRTQEDWSEGRTRVITATVAFGMGIDKPDVRFIIHYNLADSIENYVQESGRAGRDGLLSDCVLFYAPSEKSSLTHFRKEELLDIETLRNVFAGVKKALGKRSLGLVSLDNLLLALNSGVRYESEEEISETRLRVGLSLLERAGLLTRHYDLPPTVEITLLDIQEKMLASLASASAGHNTGEPVELSLTELSRIIDCSLNKIEPLLLEWAREGKIRYRPGKGKREMLLELTPVSRENAGERVNTLLEQLESAHLHRVEQIADYAKSTRCRHAFLARHFGERLPVAKCGACDICGPATNTNEEEKGKDSKTTQIQAKASSTDSDHLIRVILEALANLKPGVAMGKSGLSALLLGRETGPQSERNNPLWGALQGKLKPKALEELIDQLVQEGLIAAQKVANRYGQSYQALSLSERGREKLQPVLNSQPEEGEAEAEPPTEEDAYALAILRCLSKIDPGGHATTRTPLTGLIRLLLGQPSVLGTTSSNPYKGALAGRLKEKEIEALIGRLVEEGYLDQQENLLESGRVSKSVGLSADGWVVVSANEEGDR